VRHPAFVSRSGLEELLTRRTLELSAPARADLSSGRADPRVVSLIADLTSVFRVRVSSIKTGHPLGPLSPAGRENDHYFFRAFDISDVGGMAIAAAPTAPATVALGNRLVGLVGEMRPARVMGPAAWLAALAPGNRRGFRDDPHATAIHADHLHIGFAAITGASVR
jgi:hypothetical protein